MKNSKSNIRYAIALAPLFLTAIAAPAFAAESNRNWGDSDASYWLKNEPGSTPVVTEFTPKTAPHMTCVHVQPSGSISCFPKVGCFPKDAAGLKLTQ